MSNAETFFAGDWGTTHLRLFLCRGEEMLEHRDGPGISALRSTPEQVLLELLRPWIEQHGRLPIRLAGMVGSRNGWREAPYCACPADVAALRRAQLRFPVQGHEVTIAAGASCINPRGAADVMRGEETQIIGAIARDPALARGRHVIALPGTHTKWTLIDDGRIVSFQTSLSGELFALLRTRSTLAGVPGSGDAELSSTDLDAFDQGLQRSRELAGAPLAHILFEVRTRQLVHGMTRPAALSFLSGLIIGQDVLGAQPLFDNALTTSAMVPIIGASELSKLYARALATQTVNTIVLDASQSTVSGLLALS